MNIKKIGYQIYGCISQLFRICPVKKEKVVFFMVHNSKFKSNLGYMYQAMKKENPNRKFVIVSKADLFSGGTLKKIKGALYFYFGLNYHLATAEYVFLNDNFLPLSCMHVSKKTKIVQMWHGIGAWKRFGLTTEEDPVTREAVEKGNKKVTHLFVSAKRIVPFYEEAMGIPKERIYPVGLPVLDFYFREDMRKQARERFYESYPMLRNKKILLYTPTFRATKEENEQLLKRFQAEKLKNALGEDWAVLVRLHPALKGQFVESGEGCYDASGYADVKDLYEVADVLVNDYSSTMVEYVLLDKPIVLFSYDLEKYDRGFYADYVKNSPGPIVTDLEQLVEVVKKQEVDEEARERFLQLHYDYYDADNTKRVMEILSI